MVTRLPPATPALTYFGMPIVESGGVPAGTVFIIDNPTAAHPFSGRVIMCRNVWSDIVFPSKLAEVRADVRAHLRVLVAAAEARLFGGGA